MNTMGPHSHHSVQEGDIPTPLDEHILVQKDSKASPKRKQLSKPVQVQYGAKDDPKQHNEDFEL